MNLIFESLDEESIVLEGFGSKNKPFTEEEAEKVASIVEGKLDSIRSVISSELKELNPKLSSVLDVISDSDVHVTSKGKNIKATPIIHVKDKNVLMGILKRTLLHGHFDETNDNRKILKLTKGIRDAINKELESDGLKCELRMTPGEIFKTILKRSFCMPKSQIISMYILKK